MRAIPIYAEGFLIDMTAAQAIMRAYGLDPDEDADPNFPFILHEDILLETAGVLNNEGIECFYCSDFCGDAACPPDVLEYLGIYDKKGVKDTFENEIVLMIPLDRASELTRQSYTSVDEIVSEIKTKLKQFLQHFPEDYSFEKNIRVLLGTTYC